MAFLKVLVDAIMENNIIDVKIVVGPVFAPMDEYVTHVKIAVAKLDVNMERCVLSVKTAVERPFVHMERFVLPVKNAVERTFVHMERFVLAVKNVEIYAVRMAKGNLSALNVMGSQSVATKESNVDVHCARLSIHPFNVRFMKGF